MLLLLATLAHGQDLDDRQTFSDALLDESAYGDVSGAIETYEKLVARLAADDPLRGDVLLALGRAHWSTGRLDAARTWFLEGIRTGVCPTRCRDWLERVEVEASRIETLPTTWTFDDGSEHALFHPWRYQDRGGIRTQDGTLVWRTSPNSSLEFDRLKLGIGDVGEVHSVELRLESVSRDMTLQLVVVPRDDPEMHYGLREALRVPTGEPFAARVVPSDFAPAIAGPPKLDPTSFAELWLVDISEEGAPLVVAIDSLTIR